MGVSSSKSNAGLVTVVIVSIFLFFLVTLVFKDFNIIRNPGFVGLFVGVLLASVAAAALVRAVSKGFFVTSKGVLAAVVVVLVIAIALIFLVPNLFEGYYSVAAVEIQSIFPFPP